MRFFINSEDDSKSKLRFVIVSKFPISSAPPIGAIRAPAVLNWVAIFPSAHPFDN